MFAVIMAGGGGTRLWPESTRNMAKHFLSLVGSQSLIQQTVNRILPIVMREDIFIVTQKLQKELVRSQVPHIPEENIIVEPVGRNTLPCVGLAAVCIKHKGRSSEVMAALPADHIIKDGGRFVKLLSYAADIAQSGDYTVTLGIKPTRPETGYGYIQMGDRIAQRNGMEVFKVEKFTEKPDREVAARFVTGQEHLWNSGIFIWRVSTILDMMRAYAPDIYEAFTKVEGAIGMAHEYQAVEEAYSSMRSVSVDYGLMEKANNAVILEADIGWSDVGSWSAVHEMASKDDNGNVCKGKHIYTGTSDSMIYSHDDRIIATIGLKDIVIIDTERALLICPRDRAQDVKAIVQKLEEQGLDWYL